MSVSSLVIPSPLGPLTLFAADGAIISLDWGKGTVIDGPDSALLQEAAGQIKAYFAKERKDFDLPLDPHGTDFQKSVWSEIQNIPGGQTRSYGDIASALKSGPRAVGNACGANPIPILIPCHRVTSAKGEMCGYSGEGSVETKTRLLKVEGAIDE